MIKKNGKWLSITIDYNKGWSTHMPVLIQLAGMTDGPIMEVGTGVYSTPLLHWLCHPKKRRLISYEKDKNFIHVAKQYVAPFHSIRQIDDYQNIPVKGYYSIIFIDHEGHDRGKTAVRLKDLADYIVLHDSNVPSKNAYHLIPEAFKYYRNYEHARPWTGVASNFKELDNLW